MALSDEVILRISNNRLVPLTNPDEPDKTTVSTARLGAACNDVIGDFRAFAGLTYDGTLTEHVGMACAGVEIYLRRYQGRAEADEIERWRNGLGQLMAQTAWVAPATNSTLQPSTDQELSGGGVARPDFDRGNYADYRPSQSGASPFPGGGFD